MTMNKLIKFENIDILKSLKAIMRQNTEAYREDFNADMQYIGAMSHSNLDRKSTRLNSSHIH